MACGEDGEGPRLVNGETWLTIDEVATLLRIPVATLYARRARGLPPFAAKVGRHLRYRRTGVESWLLEQEGPASMRCGGPES